MNNLKQENQTGEAVTKLLRVVNCMFCGKRRILRTTNVNDRYYPDYICNNKDCIANPKNIVASKGKTDFLDELENELEPEFSDLEAMYMKIFNKESVDAETRSQITLFKHLIDMWMDDYFDLKDMEHRLETEPQGFHYKKNGYPCCVCGRHTKIESSWFDKYGIKCLTCQKALRERIIPASVCKNRKSWFTDTDLRLDFGVDSKTIRRLIKTGELKPRNIMGEDGRLWFQLFTERDNKQTLIRFILDGLEKPAEPVEATV